jgi:hypothetical protein
MVRETSHHWDSLSVPSFLNSTFIYKKQVLDQSFLIC